MPTRIKQGDPMQLVCKITATAEELKKQLEENKILSRIPLKKFEDTGKEIGKIFGIDIKQNSDDDFANMLKETDKILERHSKK